MASTLQIEAYKKLKAIEPEALTWEECKMMDKLVKDETLRILQQRVGRAASRPVAKFAYMMAVYNWGSVVTDEFCKAMNAYPEWV